MMAGTNEGIHSPLRRKDLALGFARVITDLGEKTSPDTLAEAGTEASLADLVTDMTPATIELDGEAAHGLSGKTSTGTAETCRAMLNPAADTGALKGTTETGSEMRITRQKLGHETPPSASEPRGGLPAFI